MKKIMAFIFSHRFSYFDLAVTTTAVFALAAAQYPLAMVVFTTGALLLVLLETVFHGDQVGRRKNGPANLSSMKIVKFDDGKYGIRIRNWFHFEYMFFDFSANLSSLQHKNRLSSEYWMSSSKRGMDAYTHVDITTVLDTIDKMRRRDNTDHGTVVSTDDVPFIKAEPTVGTTRPHE